MATKRNQSIDILKFIAVLLITNSHFDEQYTCCKELATGGAIGDVLFFFCSGYTLFLGRLGRFDTWYKRRIRRIYPSVFALALGFGAIYGSGQNLFDLLLTGGEWFISCIMIYYALWYFIRRYFGNHLNWVYFAYAVVVVLWYMLFHDPIKSICYANCPSLSNVLLFSYPNCPVWIYKWNYLKWAIYFVFFLLGSHIGRIENECVERKTYRLLPVMIQLLCYTFAFYGIQVCCTWYPVWGIWQIASVLPLLGICIMMYRLTETSAALRLYDSKYIGRTVSIVGGLCLEIYLVQPLVRTTALNFLFPLNLLILFVAIVVAAYVCRVVGRIFQQTFSSEDGYRWDKVFEV